MIRFDTVQTEVISQRISSGIFHQLRASDIQYPFGKNGQRYDWLSLENWIISNSKLSVGLTSGRLYNLKRLFRNSIPGYLDKDMRREIFRDSRKLGFKEPFPFSHSSRTTNKDQDANHFRHSGDDDD
jgi:hypothetical protein